MIIFEQISRIVLTPGDRVVSACQFRDYVLVVTEQGHIIKLSEREYG